MQESILTAAPATDSPSDLVAAAKRGDREAFGALAHGCERMLYRVSRTVLRDDEDCADAVQEALTKAWLRLGSLREPAYFRTWLVRILLNECYRQLRRGRRTAAAPGPVPAPQGPERDELIDLEAALMELPARYRTALVLYHVEDMPVGEIARALRLPAGTVKTRLMRARAKLAANLRQREEP
jgi:RNA polymerase sigma factor (sigma-70 family)